MAIEHTPTMIQQDWYVTYDFDVDGDSSLNCNKIQNRIIWNPVLPTDAKRHIACATKLNHGVPHILRKATLLADNDDI